MDKNLAEKFIEEVSRGDGIHGKWVKLAVQRHLDDLKNGKKRGIYFDQKEGETAIKFFSLLKHTKGEWKGKNFNLQPFQAFIIYSIFGWKRENGKRRFRKCYNKIARKNGKTELAAGVGLYCFYMDNESGAEIYTVATKKDQAKIAFKAISTMAKTLSSDSPAIKKITTIREHRVIKNDESVIRYLGKDSNTEDGLNPHCGIVDEYHAHPTSDMLEILETGMGARLQPLIFIITTAGFNKQSPCFKLELVCQQILTGSKTDDSMFCIMFDLDEEDDYHIEANWRKPNPNLGDAPYLDFLQDQYIKAQNEGSSKLTQFLTKNLNKWTTAHSKWFTDTQWKKCGCTFEEAIKAQANLKNRLCFGGLDLAATRDITALTLFFPAQNDIDRHLLKCWFFVPQEGAEMRAAKDKVKYLDWIAEGYIIPTEGNVTDYAYIEKTVLDLMEAYNIQSIGYDRYNSSQLVINLTQEGTPMEPFGQGYVSMSAPTKALEKMILGEEVNHLNNPVLAWMAENVTIEMDAAGNIKITKKKSTEKVDGMVASVMAIGEWLDYIKEFENDNAYNERGIRLL